MSPPPEHRVARRQRRHEHQGEVLRGRGDLLGRFANTFHLAA